MPKVNLIRKMYHTKLRQLQLDNKAFDFFERVDGHSGKMASTTLGRTQIFSAFLVSVSFGMRASRGEASQAMLTHLIAGPVQRGKGWFRPCGRGSVRELWKGTTGHVGLPCRILLRTYCCTTPEDDAKLGKLLHEALYTASVEWPTEEEMSADKLSVEFLASLNHKNSVNAFKEDEEASEEDLDELGLGLMNEGDEYENESVDEDQEIEFPKCVLTNKELTTQRAIDDSSQDLWKSSQSTRLESSPASTTASSPDVQHAASAYTRYGLDLALRFSPRPGPSPSPSPSSSAERPGRKKTAKRLTDEQKAWIWGKAMQWQQTTFGVAGDRLVLALLARPLPQVMLWPYVGVFSYFGSVVVDDHQSYLHPGRPVLVPQHLFGPWRVVNRYAWASTGAQSPEDILTRVRPV